MPYLVLMPIFASDVLAGGPRMLGFLMGSAGCGALTGALYLASRTSVRGLGRLMVDGDGADAKHDDPRQQKQPRV